jgi:hypothetical protein
MGAQTKLNASYVNGSLVLAAIVGMLSQSWMGFCLVAIILICGNCYLKSIRLSGQRRIPQD